MKKLLTSRFKKSKKGEISSQDSHHIDEGTHWKKDEEESYHQLVLYEPPSRVIEPESGLMLNQEEV
jgi:hypothetical protein